MRTLDTRAFLDAVCQMLREGAENVPIPVAGTSMCPFLYPGDTAYLSLPDTPLKKGDLVLFTRPSGQYVLHRIVKVCADGSFLLLGDSQLVWERVASAGQIHARVVRARRAGKLIAPGDREWWLFEKAWVWLSPIRRYILWMHRLLRGK